MPALRGHHLICLHFFNGEGYNPEFLENLRNVLEVVDYQKVDILHGADDVCGKCPNLKQDQCKYTESADAEIREMDNRALRLLGLSGGTIIRWEKVRNRIPDIFHIWYKDYCKSCGWKRACERNDSYKQLSGSIHSTKVRGGNGNSSVF